MSIATKQAEYHHAHLSLELHWSRPNATRRDGTTVSRQGWPFSSEGTLDGILQEETRVAYDTSCLFTGHSRALISEYTPQLPTRMDVAATPARPSPLHGPRPDPASPRWCSGRSQCSWNPISDFFPSAGVRNLLLREHTAGRA